MKNTEKTKQFYEAFLDVAYPCFWLGWDGLFWQNAAAENSPNISPHQEGIKRLLQALAEETSLLRETEHACPSEESDVAQITLFKTSLRMMGVEVLPHPEGLFASCQIFDPVSLGALSYGLREPVSDLFSSVQTLARRLEQCPLSESDELFFGECINSIQQKEYSLLRLAYNLEAYNLMKTRSKSRNPIELNGFVRSLCKKAQRAFINRQVALHLELEDGIFALNADARLLGHALTNLLRNSLQFTREGNEVTVRLKRVKNRALLSVCDRGLGIRSDALSHVFVPYYSASPHLDTPERPGLGLGLPLVRKAVQSMGGVVTIESEFGQGTCVHLALPLCETQISDLQSNTFEGDEFWSDNQSPIYIQLCGYIPLPVL